VSIVWQNKTFHQHLVLIDTWPRGQCVRSVPVDPASSLFGVGGSHNCYCGPRLIAAQTGYVGRASTLVHAYVITSVVTVLIVGSATSSRRVTSCPSLWATLINGCFQSIHELSLQVNHLQCCERGRDIRWHILGQQDGTSC